MSTTEQARKHDYKIQIAPCNITGEHTKVISVMLGTLDIEPDDGGEKQSLEVWGAFSDEGLNIMKRALEEAPFPVDLPTPEGIRANTKYQWTVHYGSGNSMAQFPGDHNLGEVDLHQVVAFNIVPKDENTDLPYFSLSRSQGFVKYTRQEDKWVAEKLCLPMPHAPFHIEYQRRNTITFAAGPPGSDVFPTHVRHELGWRVDTLHGDDHETTFIIGIEDDDGSWQVLKKEPLESRHFASNNTIEEVDDEFAKEREIWDHLERQDYEDMRSEEGDEGKAVEAKLNRHVIEEQVRIIDSFGEGTG